jgi:uncharacterized Tic20 family protein
MSKNNRKGTGSYMIFMVFTSIISVSIPLYLELYKITFLAAFSLIMMVLSAIRYNQNNQDNE